jgi:hypothetical protein
MWWTVYYEYYYLSFEINLAANIRENYVNLGMSRNLGYFCMEFWHWNHQQIIFVLILNLFLREGHIYIYIYIYIYIFVRVCVCVCNEQYRPKIDPWGTPYFNVPQSDKQFWAAFSGISILSLYISSLAFCKVPLNERRNFIKFLSQSAALLQPNRHFEGKKKHSDSIRQRKVTHLLRSVRRSPV